ITNSNLITGGFEGILANNANATATAKVANSGTISATNGGDGIFANTVVVSGNTGTIKGDHAGILASHGDADITNSNLITGGALGILANGTAKVANAGTISATD